MSKKFSISFLRDVYYRDKPGLLEEAIEDTSRWFAQKVMFFESEGKMWRAYFSEGLTENQDHEAFEYDGDDDGMLSCSEVKKVEVMKFEWVVVKD